MIRTVLTETLGIKYPIIQGGMGYTRNLAAAASNAGALGLIGAATWAFQSQNVEGWPRSEAEFRTVAFRLANSGVTDIAISVDCFHQEHVPTAVVERNVRSLVDAGITGLGWNPCWVISKEHENPWNRRTKSILRDLAHLPVPESYGNIVQPAGNALTWLRDFMPSKMPVPTGSCGDMPYTQTLKNVSSISVEPDGSIAVCTEFIIGNVGQSNIVEILRDYDPYRIPEMRAILQGGVTQLAEVVRTKGVKADPDGYYSVCDMCISLRRKLAELVMT